MMDEDIIRNHLARIRWLKFSKKLDNVFSTYELLTAPVIELYHKVRRGINSKEKISIKLKNVIAPCALVLWSICISPFIYKFARKYPNVSTVKDLEAEHYIFVAVLTSTHPSLYDSIAKIVKKLDNMGNQVLLLTNSSVYKEKCRELTSLKNSTCILLDYELKSLRLVEYLKARKNSKRQLRQALNCINDEIIRKMFRKYQDYLELFLMFENLCEVVYSELFSKIKPNAIIANGFSGALLKVAKNMKIKRIMIQHGTQWGDDTPGVTPDVDELIIWGEFWKENFSKKMSPKAKLVPLGCPRFDEIVKWRNLKRNSSFYNKLEIDKNKTTIVFLSNSHGFRSKKFWIEIFKGLEELVRKYDDKINLIIKLHPQEGKELYLQTLNNTTFNKIKFIKNDVHLYELFVHTDIAITAGSTAMLEAIAFDIPVIQVNFTNDPEIIDFYKYGGGIIIRNKREFISTIFKLIYDENFKMQVIERQRKFLRTCLANLGHATDKVVEYILN